jgi:exodeoxyribonuclease VIII
MSSSGLKELAKSPAHWFTWRFLPRQPPTPALQFGSLYHLMILEPEEFNKKVFVCEGDKRTKKYKEMAGQVPEGGYILAPGEADVFFGMKNAFDKHLIAHSLTRPETMHAEKAGFFQIEPFTFWVSIKPDIRNRNLLIVSDLKTCQSADQEEFSKAIANFKYHWQAWLYLKGCRILDRIPYRDWLWICQEKTPPYSVVTYRATQTMLKRAEEQILPLLYTFQECLDNDSWPSYFPEDKVIDIELPRWA